MRIEIRGDVAKGLGSAARCVFKAGWVASVVAVFFTAGFFVGVFFVAIVISSTRHDGA
jgi:hypothetical protein